MTDPEIIPVVSVSGERGAQGDQGQDGHDGQDGRTGRAGRDGQTGRDGLTGLIGETGLQGAQGGRGKPFSRYQAIAVFLLLALGLGLSVWIGDRQSDRIEAQQIEIATNADLIRDSAYEGCVSGLETVKNFNAQQEALAQIERDYTVKASPAGKIIGSKRIAAYEAGKIPIRADYECIR